MFRRVAELICQKCGHATIGRAPSSAGTTMPPCERCGGTRQVVRIVSNRTYRGESRVPAGGDY